MQSSPKLLCEREKEPEKQPFFPPPFIEQESSTKWENVLNHKSSLGFCLDQF